MTASRTDSLDLTAVRRDTPGVLHRIHLNNAGAALMPAPVLQAVTDYLGRESEIGGYEAAAEQAGQLDDVYNSIAKLVGGHRDEIAVTENATVAWQRAFYAMDFQPGDRILTTSAEFAANYIAFLQIAKRFDVTVDVIPNDDAGALDPTALERMIDGKVRLIAITWIPTNGGLVNPAVEVGKIANAHGIPYLLDACQAVGQMPVDVDTLGCDMLTATGRKFLRAPRGTGFLYIRKTLLDRTEPAMLDLFGAKVVELGDYELRPDARRFETWETNYSTRLGLRAAVDYALAIGLEAIEDRCRRLADLLRAHLAAIPGLQLRDLGSRRSAIISFTLDGVEAALVMQQLKEKQINVSVSPPSSTPIDASARHLPPVVRVSPHYYNSEDEVETFVAAVRACAQDVT
ncbi:aminotransferase class V-fold PLP-dependent enzyme [Methylobacterium nodulans]|uniref:Aminotransferase class V n=1 Tax=Methylobacterium nodulans (strain LMG 21967 / CNCM I-2342 / ORS 2060) TaxID=460265 RepID=B8IW21_METNO|nr:aminotransferase class V-fold PLP-dependent enzyme [Methylobacterium nodulans]ACL62611.1 aminotransferase class V [Methylobacterium nodulans ORS 2060]